MNLLDLFVTDAHAASAAPAGQGGLESILVPLIFFFAIFYFLIIRPQSKRAKAHRQLVENLSIGDQVVTAGGIHAKVAGLQDTVVVLEIATGVKIRINRASIVSTKSGSEQAD